MPQAGLHVAGARMDDFRITETFEIAHLLKRLADGRVHVGLNAPNGRAIVATVWALDPAHDVLSFSVPPHDPQLDGVVDCDEALAVGYLDHVKLQFDVERLVLVRSGNAVALKGAFPRELYRFQRRHGFRVRPLPRTAPVAVLRHPALADMTLHLRVLDVSIGGVALFLPADVPPLEPGVLINGVVLDLDDETRVHTALRLHHVTSLDADGRGVRLGCGIVSPGADGHRALQRYIDQTQKRRRLLALD